MNSKILLFAFILMLTIPAYLQSQNTNKKIDKTNKDLKKSDDVVEKSIVLIGNILKKKDKSKKSEVNTNDTPKQTPTENTPIKTEKQVSNPTISKIKILDVPLTKEASLLFKNSISKTTNAEKNSITSLMNIKATKDGTQFFINDAYYIDYPFSIFVYPLDINNDENEEVALVYGHVAISGDNVISTLFIKDKEGKYTVNFGFSGSLIILGANSKNFPDIAMGGPGFEYPVFRWNGKEYDNYNKITDKQLEKLKPTYLEDASKMYTENLKH